MHVYIIDIIILRIIVTNIKNINERDRVQNQRNSAHILNQCLLFFVLFFHLKRDNKEVEEEEEEEKKQEEEQKERSPL